MRFKCALCEDVDLCEGCFDARLKNINLKEEAVGNKIEAKGESREREKKKGKKKNRLEEEKEEKEVGDRQMEVDEIIRKGTEDILCEGHELLCVEVRF